ncbi:MAG: type II toxin-antitoxin system PemK/MazF family toxin [Thermomicrobiales bacterium]
MPSMTHLASYRRGDVVLLEVEFADQPGRRKLRPVVIVSGGRYNATGPDLLVSTITSNLYPLPHVGDHRIQHWQQAGLKHPSIAQTKLATTDAARIKRRLGSLHPDDLRYLEAGLKAALDLL